MIEEALQYTDIEKVYKMIKYKGFIEPKFGSANPYWFFFNSSCFELESTGRIVREKGGRFFFSKKGETPYNSWRLPNEEEKIKFLRKKRKLKLKAIGQIFK